MFGSLNKSIGPLVSKIVTQNKGQESTIGGLVKAVEKLGGGKSGVGSQMKPMMGDLQKVLKLLSAQTAVLEKIGDVKVDGGGDDDKELQKALDDLLTEAKRIAAENDKQISELEGLAKEIDAAMKDAGSDKDAAKKIKIATAAMEKAQKLVSEQNKAMSEVVKALGR